MELVAFYLFAGLTIVPALFILFTRNLMYAAFALFLAFVGVAALYVFLGADFLAVAQIMIYVGGILILLIFGIMLTLPRKSTGESNYVEVRNGGLFTGILVAGALLFLLSKMLFTAEFLLNAPPATTQSTLKAIGFELMTSHLFPFELAAVILLVALVGASYLALNRKESL